MIKFQWNSEFQELFHHFITTQILFLGCSSRLRTSRCVYYLLVGARYTQQHYIYMPIYAYIYCIYASSLWVCGDMMRQQRYCVHNIISKSNGKKFIEVPSSVITDFHYFQLPIFMIFMN